MNGDNSAMNFNAPQLNDHTYNRAKARLDREELVFYGLAVAFLLLALLVYTYPSVQMVHEVYREQKVKSRERDLLAEQTRLRLEFEMLMSPSEMEQRAVAAGFAPLDKEHMVFVGKK